VKTLERWEEGDFKPTVTLIKRMMEAVVVSTAVIRVKKDIN
jgi:hypothetical protein